MQLPGRQVRDPDAQRNFEFLASRLSRSSPQARVYNNANLSIPHNTFTLLTFNSERWDTDSIHSASGSRLTCVTPGLYAFVGSATFDVNATGERYLDILLNGTTVINADTRMAITAGGRGTRVSSATYYRLAAGDYVELRALQTSGGALDVVAIGNYSPEFSMTWVSP